MNILDRYLLKSLVANYLIALAVMMSMYVLLDLFFNVDEFTEEGGSVMDIAGDIVAYYGPNLFRYFAQLSGVITLFACMITVARFRRTNELTAMLASGISLYRVAVPVVGFGVFTTALWVLDVELAIPNVAPKLAREHEDVRGGKTYGVWFLEDKNGALLSAQEFDPDTGSLKHLLILMRDEHGTAQSAIEAERADWEEIDGHPDGGRYVLTRGVLRSRSETAEGVERKTVEYYESNLPPSKILQRQSSQWIEFLGSAQLADLMDQDMPRPIKMAVQQARHQRFAAPIVNLVLLLLGLPFMLNRDPDTILTDASKCLAVCGTCFAVTFVSHAAVSSDSFSALPAWLPIIIFAPVAVVMIDRIRT